MKTSLLASKSKYILSIVLLSIGLVVIGVIHQFTMSLAMREQNYIPFSITSLLWGAFFIGELVVFSKFRYVIAHSHKENVLIVGNLFNNTEVKSQDINVSSKLLLNLFFKITIDGKSYFIITSKE